MDGQGGTDAVNLHDEARAAGRTYQVTRSAVFTYRSRSDLPGVVSYSGIERLTLGPGSGDDAAEVYGNPGRHRAERGWQRGTDSLTLDASLYQSAVTGSVTADAVTGVTGGPVWYSGVEG